jgi:hypothetical protein
VFCSPVTLVVTCRDGVSNNAIARRIREVRDEDVPLEAVMPMWNWERKWPWLVALSRPMSRPQSVHLKLETASGFWHWLSPGSNLGSRSIYKLNAVQDRVSSQNVAHFSVS